MLAVLRQEVSERFGETIVTQQVSDTIWRR